MNNSALVYQVRTASWLTSRLVENVLREDPEDTVPAHQRQLHTTKTKKNKTPPHLPHWPADCADPRDALGGRQEDHQDPGCGGGLQRAAAVLADVMKHDGVFEQL